MAKSPKKQGPTAQETALAEVSQQQWGDYVARFRPAEAALIKKAAFTAGEEASVKGQVAADAAAAFKGMARNTTAAGEIAGARANSGKTKMSLAADALSEGTARGVGKAQAELGGRLDSDLQKVRIAGIGRKIATDATADMSRGARRATSLALAESAAKAERNAATIDAAATIAGASFKKYQLNKAKKAETAKHRQQEAGGTTPWIEPISNEEIGAGWLDVDFNKIGF